MKYNFCRLLFLLFFIVILNSSYAQDNTQEDLFHVLLKLEENVESNGKIDIDKIISLERISLSKDDVLYVESVSEAILLDLKDQSNDALIKYKALVEKENQKLSSYSIFPLLKMGYVYTYNGDLENAQPIVDLLSEALDVPAYKTIYGNIQDLKFRYYNAVGDIEKSDAGLDSSIVEFRASGQLRALVVALNNKANFTMGYEVDKALEFAEEAIIIAKKENIRNSLGHSYNTKGAVLKILGKYEESVKYLYKALALAVETKDTFEIVNTNLHIAATQLDQNQTEDAILSLKKARKLATEGRIIDLIITSYYYESYAHFNEDDYQKVISTCKKGLDLSDGKYLDDEVLLRLQMAEAYSNMGELDSAYLSILEMDKANFRNEESFTIRGQAVLAQYYLSKGEYKKAKTSAEHALAFSKESGVLAVELDNHTQLASIEKQMGNYKDAYFHLEEAYKLEKDLINEQNLTDITEAKMESVFDTERKATKFQTEKEKSALKARQKLYLIILGLSLLGLGALSFFYFLMKKKNKKISDQNAALENLNNIKNTLFQIIGHDLKKPTINFRNISTNINYLLENKDYQRLELLGQEIDQDAKSLYNLTDNILNWALLQKDSISLKPQKVNLRELVNYNIDLFATLSKLKNITLDNKIDEDAYSFADRNSLDTIIRNLIDNAIKYTPKGGLISLGSQVHEGIVRVSVKDTGVGMTKNKIDSLFQNKSITSEKGTNGESGSGIGLQLIKSLIIKNNGKMKIESSIGNGATIILDLPLAS